MSIVIAEDIAFQRAHLRRVVAEQFPEDLPVLEAENGLQAVEKSRQCRPALVVLDIKLPELNGVKTAKAIWSELPLTRIIFWSHYKDETYLRELRKIVPGETVYGYVLKNSPDDKLCQALRAVVLDEQCWIDRDVRGVQTRLSGRYTGLSDVEYEALIDISLGLTDKAIARRRYLSERGVQNRLRGLYCKLNVDLEHEHPKWGHTFRPRARAVWLGLMRGLINADELGREDEQLGKWLEIEGGLKDE
jgi:DNA-binding NarL/FixJ family response regulator